MNKLETSLLGAAAISLACLWPARPLGAQEAAPAATEVATEATWLSRIDLHGFGGWAYGRTNDNSYLVGSEDGEYSDSFFALNVAAEPTDGSPSPRRAMRSASASRLSAVRRRTPTTATDRDELLQAFQEGTLPGETRLFAFGVNFSF